ncbi:hypothetical protein DITRI_Ditri03aG0023700 [Diplodiscus trichospermus]
METNERVILSKPNSSENQILENDRQEEQKPPDGEKHAATDRQESGFNHETASTLEGNSDAKVSSVKPNISLREKHVSGVATESGKLTKANERPENTSGDKIGSTSKVKENADLKPSKDLSELNERPNKKAKLDSSVKVSNDKTKNNALKPNRDSNGNNSKPVVPNTTSFEDKSRCATGPPRTARNSYRNLKVDNKLTKSTTCEFRKESPPSPPNDGIRAGDRELQVTSRPDFDRSKWFAELPWEERMQDAHKRGTLVLFQNLDPAYTSGEVEDIVYSVFKEYCKAKMVQWTAYSSPYSGQAFAIFKRSKVAEEVVAKLYEGCLLLPNRSVLCFASFHLIASLCRSNCHLLPACQILAFQGSSRGVHGTI